MKNLILKKTAIDGPGATLNFSDSGHIVFVRVTFPDNTVIDPFGGRAGIASDKMINNPAKPV